MNPENPNVQNEPLKIDTTPAPPPKLKLDEKRFGKKRTRTLERIMNHRVKHSSALKDGGYLRPLEESEKSVVTRYKRQDVTVIRRCSVCLEPATHVEKNDADPLYQRFLCEDCF